ncbi:MAG: hypothetical protein ACLVHV_03405 [Oscillospiraceae bacterium]
MELWRIHRVKDKKDALINSQDTELLPDKTQPKDDDVLELVDRKIASGERVITIHRLDAAIDTQKARARKPLIGERPSNGCPGSEGSKRQNGKHG